MKIWLNNKIVDDKDATVSVFDRGFLYGDGIFETVRGYAGIAFKLDEHLDRLYKSLEIIRIKIPYSSTVLKKQIYRLLKINGLSDAYIRIEVTRGKGTIGLAKMECETPTVVIIAKEFVPYPAKMYKNGISVKITNVHQNENSPISRIKSISFMNYILARLEAKRDGFDDALMLNSRDNVCEATVSNVFLVKGKGLLTPSLESGILPGIMRGVVMSLASRVGLKAKEVVMAPSLLYNADEMFLTNSLAEIMPVVRIGKRIVGDAKPGVYTKRIHEAYKELVNNREGL